MYPDVTATVLMPRWRQALAVSMAYSAQMTGSLYVNATLLQPRNTAVSTIASGAARSHKSVISRDLLIDQFWQNWQPRLHPAVPKESTLVPGRKWLSGFFSIGSMQKPLLRPYVVSTMRLLNRFRTKQKPRWPSFS